MNKETISEEQERGLYLCDKEQSLLLIDYQDMEQKLEDYKSRIEKAVEYIKKHLEDKKYLNELYTDERMLKIVLNILDGDK